MTPQLIGRHHGESLEVGGLVEGENICSLLPKAIVIGDAVVLLLPGGIVGSLKRKRRV